MELTYDRESLLEIAKEHFNPRPLSNRSIVNWTILHRFLMLSDAFCLLFNSKNVEAAEHLLRPLLECSMHMFIVNISNDGEEVCSKIIANEELRNIKIPNPIYGVYGEGKQPTCKLTETNIAKLMDATPFYDGNIEATYKQFCRITHLSQRHATHLVRDAQRIVIGGENTEKHKPIIDEAVAAFNYVQALFHYTFTYN